MAAAHAAGVCSGGRPRTDPSYRSGQVVIAVPGEDLVPSDGISASRTEKEKPGHQRKGRSRIEDEMVRMYVQGASVRACAAAAHVSYTTAHSVLGLRGVLRRKAGGGGRPALPVNPTYVEHFDAYCRRLAAADLSETTKVSRRTRTRRFLYWAGKNCPDVLATPEKFDAGLTQFANETYPDSLPSRDALISSIRDFGRVCFDSSARDVPDEPGHSRQLTFTIHRDSASHPQPDRT
jgi:hypothetical protein